MSGPRYTKLIQQLPATVPFVAPEAQERAQGAPFKARLGANESLFGPSPKAVQAMQEKAGETWMYGDPTSHDLRHALASHHRIDPGAIVVGEGIDGLLGYLVRLVIEPGCAVVTSDGAYPTFNYHVLGFGGQLHKVPYHDDHEDPDALIDTARKTDAKLIYLANPDNPMGSWHNAGRVQEMIERLPPGCLLVLDEAYIDFAPNGTVPDIDINDPSVIRMRTFSKAYGMAGARVGYAMGAPDLIKSFDKIRNHFGMNRVAQIGALEALRDQDWLAEVCARTALARQSIAQIAAENGLNTLPSATNFVAVDCGQTGDFARRVLENLVAQGIFVRMPFVAPQDRCIRISCGPDAEMAALAHALPVALAKASAP